MGAKNKHPLVSIVVPVYNAERFLRDTIRSVQVQTYESWELIFIDDQSKDSSVHIIKRAQKSDKRIKLIKMLENGGAANARNAGVELSKGRFLAFLDADDLWVGAKLDSQVAFMSEKACPFAFSSYEFTDERGVPNGKCVIAPLKLSYDDALKRSSVFTSTVMIDLDFITKKDIMMPNYPIGEETATWWKLLRMHGDAYGIQEVLSYYRRGTGDTLSSNKFKAMKWRWRLYRQHEKLGLFRSMVNFYHYAIYAVQRRV